MPVYRPALALMPPEGQQRGDGTVHKKGGATHPAFYSHILRKP